MAHFTEGDQVLVHIHLLDSGTISGPLREKLRNLDRHMFGEVVSDGGEKVYVEVHVPLRVELPKKTLDPANAVEDKGNCRGGPPVVY